LAKSNSLAERYFAHRLAGVERAPIDFVPFRFGFVERCAQAGFGLCLGLVQKALGFLPRFVGQFGRVDGVEFVHASLSKLIEPIRRVNHLPEA
jgi:hypothetical protein